MRRPPRYKETPDVSAAVCRLIKALGKRVAEEDPDDLHVLVRVEQALEHAWGTAVTGLRSTGHTDAQIGKALGCTKQAVQQRFPRVAA